MDQEGCKRMEREQNGIQLILEFPEGLEEEETIKKEVKDILTGLLQEHMAKFFKRDQNVFENFLEEQSGRHR